MKIIALVLAILFLQTAAKSQTAKSLPVKPKPLPEWFRVYTYDEGIVELNTKYVVPDEYQTDHIRLRWTFWTPQTLDGKSKIKYQSILQEVRINCKNKEFLPYAAQWKNARGRVVAREDKLESDEMLPFSSRLMTEKLFIPACKLIALRKKEPAAER